MGRFKHYSLFTFSVLRGLTIHILNEARLENKLAAALKQGESANRAAQDLLDRQASNVSQATSSHEAIS